MNRIDYIEKRGAKWVVLSKEGEVLGSHDTEEEAKNHLAAIEANKHRGDRAIRFDIGMLRSPRLTPQGFMKVDGYASRTGVFLYNNPDGSERRELRLPEEVFDSGSLAGFEGAPMTNDHPPDFVDAKNAKQYQVGTVMGKAVRDGSYVKVSAQITDAATIEALRAGKTQLSVGYSAEIDNTPGEHPEFGRYDGIQRNIMVNHLAIVDVGRAGPSAAVRMDAAAVRDFSLDSPKAPSYPHEGATMKTIEELQKALDAALADSAAQKSRADSLEIQVQTEKTRADKAEGQAAELEPLRAECDKLRQGSKATEELKADIAALQGKVAEFERARADAAIDGPKKLAEAVRDRVKLEGQVKTVMGSEFRCDGLSDHDLAVTCLRKLGRTVESNEPEVKVRARFDAAVENYIGTESALERVRERVAAQKKDADRYDRSNARQRMIDRNRGRAPQETK